MSQQTPHAGTAAPDPLWAAAPRFVVEIVAWVAAPWALASRSIALAVVAVVVLIGVPAVCGTPGAKAQRPLVPVPGRVSIVLELALYVVAVVASWAAWPPPAAIAVTVLAVGAAALQVPRWRWLADR